MACHVMLPILIQASATETVVCYCLLNTSALDEESLKAPLIHSNGDEEFSGDLPALRDCRALLQEWWKESKKLWYLAGPAIFKTVCQYSMGAITQTFVGHIGDLELAAVSIENSVIAGFSFGIMAGMASALETLCGQAFGARQLEMLGVYLQRSWVILNTTALLVTAIYVWAAPILKLLGQEPEIADLAAKFAVWMLPQLFAYAAALPLAKFLQSQSKVVVLAAIAGGALAVHVVLSWVFIFKLGMGTVGSGVGAGLVVVDHRALTVGLYSQRTCKEAWTGFSVSCGFHWLQESCYVWTLGIYTF